MKVINGHIITGTSICVDYWLWTPEEKYHHFLTHLHADHTVNLKSTFREKIYTSPFNAWLLRRWFNISPECIVPLSVGDSHIMFDVNTESRFSVTLLDANHCPGSVMFLFQGDFGNILYTGDFRYNPKILQNPMLKSLIENEEVDRLYLDNTFAAEHCEFPPRQEVLKDIIKLIKTHPEHNILLGVRKLGKEEVLKTIAMELKEKVCVNEEKLRILSKLEYPKVFTTDSEDSRIFVKEMPHITASLIDQLRAERGPVLAILLTALYYVIPPTARTKSALINTLKGVHKIPYSDHSCHSELVEFVSKIKPKVIYPIVTSPTGKQALSGPSEYLTCTWQNNVIPNSILQLSENPKGCELVSKVPILINNSVSDFKEKIISYTSDDDLRIGSQNLETISKRKRILKFNTSNDIESQIDIQENESIYSSTSFETASMGKCSPRVHQTQVEKSTEKFGKHIQKTSGNSKQGSLESKRKQIAKDDVAVESQDEYLTMSDENISQVNVVANQSVFHNQKDNKEGNILEIMEIPHSTSNVHFQATNHSPDNTNGQNVLGNKFEKSGTNKSDPPELPSKEHSSEVNFHRGIANKVVALSEKNKGYPTEKLSFDFATTHNSEKDQCQVEEQVGFICSTPVSKIKGTFFREPMPKTVHDYFSGDEILTLKGTNKSGIETVKRDKYIFKVQETNIGHSGAIDIALSSESSQELLNKEKNCPLITLDLANKNELCKDHEPILKITNINTAEKCVYNSSYDETSIFKEIFPIKHLRQRSEWFDVSKHNSNSSDSEVETETQKKRRKTNKHEKSKDSMSSSEYTTHSNSNLDCDTAIQGIIDSLDRENNQICKNHDYTPNGLRVSEKFKHFLIKKYRLSSNMSFRPSKDGQESSISDISPVFLGEVCKVDSHCNIRKSSVCGAHSEPIKNILNKGQNLVEENIDINHRENSSKCKTIKSGCDVSLPRKYRTHKEIIKSIFDRREDILEKNKCMEQTQNDVDQTKNDIKCNEVDAFCQNFNLAYKSWKKAVKCESEKRRKVALARSRSDILNGVNLSQLILQLKKYT